MEIIKCSNLEDVKREFNDKTALVNERKIR
jgi:hypothetical protein